MYLELERLTRLEDLDLVAGTGKQAQYHDLRASDLYSVLCRKT